jgi:hypothetical protein
MSQGLWANTLSATEYMHAVQSPGLSQQIKERSQLKKESVMRLVDIRQAPTFSVLERTKILEPEAIPIIVLVQFWFDCGLESKAIALPCLECPHDPTTSVIRPGDSGKTVHV